MEECVRFFNAMYGELEKGEFIEIRAFPSQMRVSGAGSGNTVAGQWFCPNIYSAVRAVERARKGRDVYFGVATRDGKGGEKQNLIRIPCAWADLDAKPNLQEPEARLKEAPLPPSAVVRSGRGLHLYWFFDKPVPASEHARVEEINKAIARTLRGDTLHDADRVPRPPGTYNRKHSRLLDVMLLGMWPDRRYSVEDLQAAFAPAEPGPGSARVSDPAGGSLGSARVSDPAGGSTEGLQSGCGVGRPSHSLQCGVGRPSHSLGGGSAEHTGGPDEAARLEFCPVSEWAARETPPSEFVVEGLVPLRGVTLVTGEGGIGKSFLLMDLAMSVACGKPFLDTFACRQGPALIVDLENDENSIARRVQKLLRARGVSDLPLHVARKGGLFDAELAIDKEPSLAALTASLEAAKPVALIIDPLTAAHSKDENDNIAMRSVIRTLSRLAQRFEMAVIVAHHPRKRGQNNDAGQMIRGASDLRNSVDSHIFLRRIDGSRLLVEHDKSRHAPALEKFQVEMTDSEDGESIRFNHLGPAPEAAVKSAEVRAFILATLESGPRRRKEILVLAEAEGLHFRVTENALTAMTEEGVIARPERGLYERAEAATDSTLHMAPI